MKKFIREGKKFYERLENVDAFGLSAQLAYFFLLSLFPFLLFLINLIGYFPLNEDVVLNAIADFAPAQVTELIQTNIEPLLNVQNGGLLSVGIIGTLWAASNGMNAVTKAINRAYGIEPKRSFIMYRLISILLTIAMFFVILIALLLPVFGRMIGEYLFSFIDLSAQFLQTWETFRWVSSSIIFFVALIFLYRLAPRRRVYFKDIVWGTLFSTISWQVVSFGFSFYVGTLRNYSTTYGSLGTVIVLMVWFYLFGLIVILGGVLNAYVSERKKE
ncbi:YihY/virulence factor BrkB family protein [Oceanobacillus sp. CAU 1775]